MAISSADVRTAIRKIFFMAVPSLKLTRLQQVCQARGREKPESKRVDGTKAGD
jgi:dsRNA-specific ribonuclease